MTQQRRTRLGPIRGVERDGVASYLGVRYAEPPRRFQPPVQSGAWSGTLDATKHGPQPVQDPPGVAEVLTLPNIGAFSEDCLRLNIHAPAKPSPSPRPVLVWIYGGAFRTGSSNQYDGTALARGADAVVVVINYRLGILGCMDLRPLGSGFEKAVNVWLQDQITALRWIKDNISDYGGNPDCVTIFGQSAGGTSVTALCASDDARGLFHRALALSPAFMNPGSPDYLPAVAKKRSTSIDETYNWLSLASPADLLKFARRTFFYPFIDGEIVTTKPEQAMQRSPQVPFMAGFAFEDGKFLEYLHRAQRKSLINIRLGLAARFVAHLVAGSHANSKPYRARLKAVKKPKNGREWSFLVWNDIHRRASLIHCDAASRSGSPAWHYRFDVPNVIGGKVVPATHCVDIPFSFNWLDDPKVAHWIPATDANRKLCADWVDALSRFARHGSPEGGPLGDWPAYGTERNTRSISSRSAQIIKDLDSEYRTSIWSETF